MSRRFRQVWLPVVLALVALNSAFLAAFDDPTLLRVASGLLHLLLGVAFCVIVILSFKRDRRKPTNLSRLSGLSALLTFATGALLVVFGNLAPQHSMLVSHAWLAVGGLVVVLVWILGRARERSHKILAQTAAVVVVFSTLAAAGFVTFYHAPQYSIENDPMPPATMADESYGGKDGPFFPSAAFTQDAETIPASFFNSSETCGRAGCHPDVVSQWQSSAHKFSSFNNQWYRKSITYMQEVNGLEAPKWCAGCHDQAILFSGQMAQPVDSIMKLPESHAGVGCMSCHSLRSVSGTLGNGGVEIAYPFLQKLATSQNRLVQILHDFAVRIDPEPHRRAFLKPLHQRQTAEFCSSCHKAHLDVPVNNYRWVRGFNTYDSWQASGVSGFGARSFYQPEAPQDCKSCHMPSVASNDAGNDNGLIRSHRFVGANTALPVANQDDTQLRQTVDFLKADRLKVDVFAVVDGPPQEAPAVTSPDAIDQTTTFANGDELGMTVGSGGVQTTLQPIVAPLRPGITSVRRGTSVRLDVVVRSLSVGHFFPSGTVDAQEAWLEVKVLDERDDVVFWSGRVADDGLGPVDPSAHFYRSVLVDERSNKINKRNTWAARSTVYVNLIPPGESDVAHYRLPVPRSTGSLKVIASLHYRKFDWWHTQFAYAGVPAETEDPADVSVHFDDRTFEFTGSTENVSGSLKRIPDVPVVTMASDTTVLRIGALVDAGAIATGPEDRSRWNDYGIGLLREGDLKGAERAFQKVVEVDPGYADGWVNLARVYLREGNLDEAERMIQESESVHSGFYKARYFHALIFRSRGHYEAALEALHGVARRFPRDRVVLAEMGRVNLLSGNLQDAAAAYEQVLHIDPEDIGAHYNLMLVYRALDDNELADQHQLRYQRYKADERAPAIARAYSQANPFDNNETLAVHEHSSGESQ